MINSPKKRATRQSGFSVAELLVVVTIIAVMGSVALFYATAHKKLYQPDDQSLQLVDMMQEARQRALTERRTMRVEINLSTNMARLYDENLNATTPDDDVLLKGLTLFAPTNVRIDTRPSEIGYNPPELMTVPNAVYQTSVYPPSISQNVCTIRFLSNGQAVNAGNNAIGTGAVPTGVTLHIWAPNKTNNTQSDIARAITILGATGVIRLWEFDHGSQAPNKWKDSRRSSTYGG